MKFDNVLHLIAEASQEVVNKLDKMEKYFDTGGFKELYPQEHKKYIDHVRRENYFYKRKDGIYYALLIVLKSNTYDEDKDRLVKIIKDLEIIQDNNAKVNRNGIIIKVLIKDKNTDKENNRATS